MHRLILFLTFILSGFFMNQGYSQINVFHIDNNSSVTSKEGVFYSLPRTVIRIDVEIDRIENYKGPYSEYALKYLGLKNVVMANSVEYKILGMKVTTSQQPDPNQYYFLELPGKISKSQKAGLLSFTESGLILGSIPQKVDTLTKEEKIINKEEPGLATEKDIFPEIFKYSADVNFFEKVDTIIRKVNIDTMTLERQYLKRTIVEKPSEQKAKEASDYIQKIKDNRFNLISGFQEVSYNKETLEYMDIQLKQMEEEYMKLFTGISIHKTLTFSFYYTPNPNQVNAEVPIFKYMKSKGMMELDEPGGKIVTIKVQRSGTTSSVASYLKQKNDNNKVHGFYYRIPELARVTVKVDDNMTQETQCLVSQLGIVSFLPTNKWKVLFYKETGGLKGISIE
jgi:TorA maturation chaperone TorD